MGIPIHLYLYVCSRFSVIRVIYQKGIQLNLVSNKMDGKPHTGLVVKNWDCCAPYLKETEMRMKWRVNMPFTLKGLGSLFLGSSEKLRDNEDPYFKSHSMSSYPCRIAYPFTHL